MPDIQWQKCFGTNEVDYAMCISETDHGYMFGIAIYTDGPGISNYHGGGDIWIINTDSTGNIIWEKCFGGSNGETCNKILKLNNNEFYIVGSTNSLDGDISCGTLYGSSDFWIIKINGDGDILWDRCYGSLGPDEMRDAVLTPDGGLLFMGRISNNGGNVTNYYGSYDIWFCKIDSLGNIEWEKTVGNQSLDNGISMQLISDTSFAFIGGYDDPGGMIDCEIAVSGFYSDVYLVEMSLAEGDILNIYCYGGSGNDLGFYFEKLDDGYIFAAYTNSYDGDVSGFHGGSDMWVVRTNDQGQIVWQRCIGGSFYEIPSYITQVDDGGFLVIGYTSSHNGDVTHNHSHQGGAWYDIWVVKLTAVGEIEWDKCYGGLGTERFFGTHSILKKSDYIYVFNAEAQFNSIDVQCEIHGERDAWVFEIALPDTTSVIIPPASAGEIRVYPNPATTELWLQLPENMPFNQAQIELYSPTGKLLYRAQLASQFHKIETAHLPAGLYLVRLWDGERWMTEKVVVE